jgi:hypothetical protein
MGVFQGDVIIKAMIDLSIEEMRKNPWLLDHAFESLKVIQYIADKYGQPNIDAAKEWFRNSKIDVYMRPRDDKDIMPFVSVLPGGSVEKIEMKHMGDLSTVKKLLLPNKIGEPIPYVVNPFSPTSYDGTQGLVGVDPNTPGLIDISPGMVLINVDTGNGYVIQSLQAGYILIEPGIDLHATKLAVIPIHQFYEARVEHTFNQETYSIGCYAHGDVQNLIFLHTIVYYAIMRYRQVLLEGNGFAESVIRSGEVGEDQNYNGPAGEKAYARFITITGQVEQSWIKAPKRFIESVVLQERVKDITKTGIKIISNHNTPPSIDQTQEPWITKVDLVYKDFADADDGQLGDTEDTED